MQGAVRPHDPPQDLRIGDLVDVAHETPAALRPRPPGTAASPPSDVPRLPSNTSGEPGIVAPVSAQRRVRTCRSADSSPASSSISKPYRPSPQPSGTSSWRILSATATASRFSPSTSSSLILLGRAPAGPSAQPPIGGGGRLFDASPKFANNERRWVGVLTMGRCLRRSGSARPTAPGRSRPPRRAHLSEVRPRPLPVFGAFLTRGPFPILGRFRLGPMSVCRVYRRAF